jgi:hypothetical protein
MKPVIQAAIFAVALTPLGAAAAERQDGKPSLTQTSLAQSRSPAAAPRALMRPASANESAQLRQELNLLREEVGRLSLEAMIGKILTEESGSAKVRSN